jgi:parallel beta-helix repeat protein
MNDLAQHSLPHSRRGFSGCALTLSLIAALLSTASLSAATLCVDQHGKPGCVSTISAAVSAAKLGDSIHVDQGYYTEDVVIGTQLSLVGDGPENTTIDAMGLSNGIYIDGFDNPGLTQVVVTGFTIKNANFEGIVVNDATDVTIWGNVVRGNDRSLQASGSACPGLPPFETAESTDCGEGIHLAGVTHSTVSDNIVTQNAGGILVSDETAIGHDDLVARNLVIDNSYNSGITLSSHPAYMPTKNPTYGIYNIVLSDNDCVHNGFGGGGGGGGAGIGLFAPGAGNQASRNTILGNRLIANALPGILIHDNSYVPGSSNNPDISRNLIEGNYIAGNGADPGAPTTVPTGISIVGAAPAVDVVVTGNFVEGEGIDVFLETSATLSLHLNDLEDGNFGAAIAGRDGRINATENWWGCAAGPGASGCSATSGDDIAFTPWLTKPTGWIFLHKHDHGIGHHYSYDDGHDYDFSRGDHDGHGDHGDHGDHDDH